MWSDSYAGPAGDDYGTDVVTSPDGARVFTTGVTETGTSDAQWLTRAHDAATGALLWTATHSAPIAPIFSGGARAQAIDISPDGSKVFVTGTEWGGETWTTPRGNREDLRTIAYNASTGALLWSAGYAGPWKDSVADIAVTGDGSRVVIVGQTLTGPASGSSPQDGDVLAIAYDTAAGSTQWHHTSDGTAGFSDEAFAVASSDAGGRVYVAAMRWNTGGIGDFVTMAFDGAATPTWTQVFDQPAGHYQQPSDIAVSADGQRVVVVGRTVIPSVDYDYLTVSYQADGTLEWSARYGMLPDSSHDVPLAVTLSPTGDRVFVTGLSGPTRGTGGSIMFTEPATVAYDGASGSQLWVGRQTYNQQGSSKGADVAVSPDGRFVYVVAVRGDTTIQGDIQAYAYLAKTGLPLWQSPMASPAPYEDAIPSLAVNPASGWVHLTGEGDGSGTSGDYLTATLDPSYVPSEAEMVIPWGQVGLRDAAPVANPTLGHARQGGTGVSPGFGTHIGAEETVEFSVNAGRLGQFEHLGLPTVPLYLDLTLNLLTSRAVGAPTFAVRAAALEVQAGSVWNPAGEVSITPSGANPDGSPRYIFTRPHVEVPTALLGQGVNQFRLRLLDETADGQVVVVGGVVTGALLQLTAPPTYILHGWDFDKEAGGKWYRLAVEKKSACASENPAFFGAVDWQCATRDRMIVSARDAFGQNPWHWDQRAGMEAVRPFAYNPKQDARKSAGQLRAAVNAAHTSMGWTGKPALFGYSFGGLVSRSFAYDNGGFAADTLVTQATPHDGARTADYYTCDAMVNSINDKLEYYHTPVPGRTGHPAHLLFTSKSGGVCTWKDYYNTGTGVPVMGAYKFHYEEAARLGELSPTPPPDAAKQGTGFDYLADFQLKTTGPDPATPNAFLVDLRAKFDALPLADRNRHVLIAGLCSRTPGGASANCPNDQPYVPNWFTQWVADGILNDPVNDLVVPVNSALMLAGAPAGPRRVVCTGENFGHVRIFLQVQPAVVALKAIADQWENEVLNAAHPGCAEVFG